MGRRAKYPSPEVAVSHFTAAVSDASTQAKWGTRAAEGAGKLGDWFRLVLPGLYAKIATLPVEPKDPWAERSKPVGQYIKNKKAEYRKAKLRALAGIGASPATPA
jgi:hypothetical protein